jgi:uncharacterized protein (UPF0332 family)
VSYAQELLKTAQGLMLDKDGQSPSRADCNRATSTIYYALFDCICSAIANRVSGTVLDQIKPSDEWTKVYRFIDHAALELALFRVTTANETLDFFAKTIAATFKRCRDERTKADYDRGQDVDLGAAKQLLAEAYSAIAFVEDAQVWGFDAASWLSGLIIELFFSKLKR